MTERKTENELDAAALQLQTLITFCFESRWAK